MPGYSPIDFPPASDASRHPLTVEQTEEFYDAAKRTDDLRVELTGRTLLDFGLRIGELAHITDQWIKQEPHWRGNGRTWCIDVPMGERCTGGAEPHQHDKQGADRPSTNRPCYNCRRRSYETKSWVDDDFHEQYPFHPKTVNSFKTNTWALPTSDCEQTALLLSDFLAPDRQWPVGPQVINKDLDKIRKEAKFDRKVNAQALRHTYGCRLAAAGEDLTTRLNQLRHSDIKRAKWYADVRSSVDH